MNRAERRKRKVRYISVFSGIEAATVAWEPLGWDPVAFCEIDAFPSAVLAHRFPNVPNLGDITKVDWRNYRGEIDIIVGGSPCQSFSIAGNRTGLDGASGLMWEYVRCVREVRPRWFVWENVPGALSSSKGEDFRCLLESMDELGYGLAWRILDAQFFGVPQRRRRLFLVGCLGDRRAADVLFEPDCLRRDSTSSRDKRKSLTERIKGSSGIRSKTMLVRCGCEGGGKGALIQDDMSATLSTSNAQTLFQPICMAEGVRGDASRAIAANQRGEIRYDGVDGDTVGALPASRSGRQIQAVICMADSNTNAAIDRDMCGTLKVRCLAPIIAHDDGCMTPWDVQSRRIHDENGSWPALYAGEGGGHGYVFIGESDREDYRDSDRDRVRREGCGGLHRQGNASSDGDGCCTSKYIVRRLTPVECERLQGFPDGWTDIEWKGKKAPDGKRYKTLGNSMAVPVMRWIGERIDAVYSEAKVVEE